MDLVDLVGQTFQENEFYEILLFEVEENFDKYFEKYFHFYFERIDGQKIRITEVISFNNSKDADKKSRSLIEKKEWFDVVWNYDHVNLLLTRLDRTGTASSIWKNSTDTYEWCRGWADETPHEPMTREEIRLAFQELAGLFQNQQEIQKLRNKKAV